MSLIWRLVAVAALVLWASTGRAVDRYVVEVTNTFASITFGYCETLGGSTWECLRQVVEQRNATHPESGPHHFGDISNCGNLLSSTVGASCTAIFYNAPGAAVPNGANTVKFWTRAVEPFAPAGGGGGGGTVQEEKIVENSLPATEPVYVSLATSAVPTDAEGMPLNDWLGLLLAAAIVGTFGVGFIAGQQR